MVIQSHALWPEQMYLDRVTVRDAKASLARSHSPRDAPRALHTPQLKPSHDHTRASCVRLRSSCADAKPRRDGARFAVD
jgi:hypothetical protein